MSNKKSVNELIIQVFTEAKDKFVADGGDMRKVFKGDIKELLERNKK